MLAEQAGKDGALRTDADEFPDRVSKTLQMIVATKEYLYA